MPQARRRTQPEPWLAERARDWRWSSVRAHLAGRDDELVRVAPLLERYGPRLGAILAAPAAPEAMAALRAVETIGRRLGAPTFLERLARDGLHGVRSDDGATCASPTELGGRCPDRRRASRDP